MINENEFDSTAELFDQVVWDRGFWGTLWLFVTYPWLGLARQRKRMKEDFKAEHGFEFDTKL